MMITTEQKLMQQFDQLGYVVVRGLLDVEQDIRPLEKEYSTLLDRLARQWRDDGKISDLYEDLPFGQRLIQLVCKGKVAYGQHFDISLPQADIREDTPIHVGPAAFSLLRSTRLLDMVERFIGPEIYSNPVQHSRIKLPEQLLPDEARSGITAGIPWHQDQGVVDPEADQTDTLTVWFPITPATLKNGCLGVVPRSHRGPLALHCRGSNRSFQNQLGIPENLVSDDRVALPMQPGDVLFMHRRTQHTGMVNRSDDIRWSFDLRYHRIGEPTGRSWFPGFVARSRKNPDSELTDAVEWANSWYEARRRLTSGGAVAFNRWANDDPRCA